MESPLMALREILPPERMADFDEMMAQIAPYREQLSRLPAHHGYPGEGLVPLARAAATIEHAIGLAGRPLYFHNPLAVWLQPHANDPLAPWLALWTLTRVQILRASRVQAFHFENIRSVLKAPFEEPLVRLAGAESGEIRAGLFEILDFQAQSWPAPPPGLGAVVASGLIDRSVRTRAAATRLLSRYGAAILPDLEAARRASKGKAARQLDEALAPLIAPPEPPMLAADTPEPEGLTPREKALNASRRGDHRSLLLALLPMWRDTRSPEIARILLALSPHLSGLYRLPSRPIAEAHAKWAALAATGDPLALAALLDAPWPTKWRDAEARIAQLAAFAPDPRVAAALATLAASRRYGPKELKTFWKETIERAISVGDPSIADELRKAVGVIWESNPNVRATLERKIAAIPAPVPLPPEDAGVLSEIGARLGSDASGSEARLLADIYASPDEDDLRLVYADVLTQRGDPRGEFIALQCARASGGGTPAQLRRERSIEADQGDKWAEPFAGLAREGRRFERGFLSSGILNFRYGSLSRVLSDPLWSTVRELGIADQPSSEDVQALSTLPSLRALHVAVGGWRFEGLVGLTSDRLEELSSPWYGANFSPPALENLPRVVRMTFTSLPTDAAPILRWLGPWTGRLKRLSLAVGPSQFPPWQTLAERLPETVDELAILDQTTLWAHVPDGWTLLLTRGPDGRFTQLRASYAPSRDGGRHILLAQVLSRIDPKRLTRIVVEPSRVIDRDEDARRALVEALARFPKAEITGP